MMLGCYVTFAHMYRALRECVIVDRSQETSELAVAELNICLDQLHEIASAVETKIEG